MKRAQRGFCSRTVRALASTICMATILSGTAARSQETAPPPAPMPQEVIVDESHSMVIEDSGHGVVGLTAHLGCASCGGCGPGCPFSKPQPTLAEKRAEVASQFLSWARPQSLLRLHYSDATDLEHPDRATYFFSKQAIESANPNTPREETVDFGDFSYYMETASSPKASAFVEIPMRFLEPDIKADRDGLGDISIGTKLVLCDKNDFLLTFQFKTYIPSGASDHGNGTGHTSLEPAFLTSWKLWQDTYLQNEYSLWIPIGGDRQLEGQVLKIGLSLNYILWENECCNRALIPTFEVISWIPLSGEFFSIVDQRNRGGDNVGIVNLGPGVRWVWSEHCEFGFGANFNVSSHQWYDTYYQFQFRWYF